ncbi:MAG TPA: GEVED domain-containing protein [Chitinophagaceae bacterium]|nr:GEVED domain-containing protein [Chitinophagaceae bacterium]
MRRLIAIPFIFFFLSILFPSRSWTQCTTANVNWDNLEYFYTSAGNYSYVTAAMITTQNFAIGKNMVTVTMGSNITSSGEVATHTGEGTSYGAGEDIAYTVSSVASPRTITLGFLSEVSTFKLSLYDIDINMRVTVTAVNALGTAQTITLSKPGGGTVALASNPGTSPTGTGTGTNQAVTSTNGTVSIDIAGPVKTVTLAFSNATGDFYMSDIQACVTGSFATNYYMVSQPFTGQPSYTLAVHDQNTVYMVDPGTGRAVSMFTDNTTNVHELNNLAYDPYNHVLYYTVDGAERLSPVGNPDTVRNIRKYDFNTETISDLVTNVNNSPLYIPTFTAGMESGGAAYYDGCLYEGVEGYFITGTKNSGRESAIWRIDFDGSLNATRACMVYATPCDNGTSNIHDWADFIIKNGTLYDYNSISPGTYTHLNLQTCAVTATYTAATTTDIPKQAAQLYDGTLCWVSDSIGYYNGTNAITSKKKIVAAAGSVTWLLKAGDATEAFVPKADFGDAPSTYDPVALSPALHEKDTSLQMGSAYDWEWSKQTSSDATGDGADEDGLAYVPVLPPTSGSYTAQVTVHNTTGSNATLIAWLDYNGNGVFDASEAITPITVPSSGTDQSFWLFWPSVPNSFSNGQYTFLRIRITSAANGMTTSNPTGYYNSGEVEDYKVLVDNFPLNVNLLSFDARVINSSTVRLDWSTTNEENLNGFSIERSTDGINWRTIGSMESRNNGAGNTNDYVYNDLQALKGKSWYRIKLYNNNNSPRYSEVRAVLIKDALEQVSIMPNPARSSATVYINSNISAEAKVLVSDMQGRLMSTQVTNLVPGGNTIGLDHLDKMPEGTYIVQVVSPGAVVSRKLLISRTAIQ